MDKLRKEGTAFASKRSEDYMSIRRDLEERARNLFIAKGGKPVQAYPHYMTLGQCDWLIQWYNNGEALKVPLDAFDAATISFTYGDLFPTMRFKDGKSYREQVYVKDEILKLVEQFGWPQEWNKDGSQGPERYIEVQIWDTAEITKVINKY
ncbi:hypothetical protein D3C77_391770 [compost metagenome]